MAPSRPDCDDSGSINLPTLIIFSQMTVHKPTWPYYDRQPPTPAGCAKVLAPKCDDYHSFAGVSLHECQHRMGTEQTIAEAFQDLLQKIRAIQSTVRSQCYQCCLEQLPKADKAYLDFVYKDLQKLIDEGPGNEETAHSKECAYYSQTFSGGCSPAPSPSPSPR